MTRVYDRAVWQIRDAMLRTVKQLFSQTLLFAFTEKIGTPQRSDQQEITAKDSERVSTTLLVKKKKAEVFRSVAWCM